MRELLLENRRRFAFTAGFFMVSLVLVGYTGTVMNETWDNIRIFYLVCIFLLAGFCEFVDTSLGMGYGTSLTPVLLLAGFSPLEIIPSILASELLTGGFAAYMHHRDGNLRMDAQPGLKRFFVILLLFSLAGAVFAVIFSFRLSGDMWKYIITAIICSMGALILFCRNRKTDFNPGRLLFVGLVAAFNKGISGGGYGPLMTAGQVTSGISSRNAVALTSFSEFFTSLVAFSAFMISGVELNYALMIPLVLGAVCAVPFATLTVQKVPEQKLKKLIGILTLTLGSLMGLSLLVN